MRYSVMYLDLQDRWPRGHPVLPGPGRVALALATGRLVSGGDPF